jgi:demethoxyubiquinone hydroxylase (CLK1/Coq7/Cat5 family)
MPSNPQYFNGAGASRSLIKILRAAHSGELGAALAYRGHWKSLSDITERDDVRKIEADEWTHRGQVREMLVMLGERPSYPRDGLFWCIGCLFGFLCRLGGRYLPMYFAGLIEYMNVDQYNRAAKLALGLGIDSIAHKLAAISAAEKVHADYFANLIARDIFNPIAHKAPR